MVANIAIGLSGAGVLVTGGFAYSFLRDPIKGMRRLHHRRKDLPQIMAGRYSGFCLLALGATLYRDLNVIAYLFAVFAFYSFFDTWVYARQDLPFAPHLAAALLAGLVTLVALVAQSAAEVPAASSAQAAPQSVAAHSDDFNTGNSARNYKGRV